MFIDKFSVCPESYRSFNPGKKDEFGVKIICLKQLVPVHESVS